MDHAGPAPSLDLRPGAGGASLKLVFRGVGGVKHLLGRKEQAAAWRHGGSSEQREAGSPSQAEPGALSDSPSRPFSPSSAEPSPAVAPPGGPRSVHGQAPGKQPYPDDRTPEAEAARAQQAGGDSAAGAAGEAPPAAAAAAAAAGPRSVHGQPPGKQPHPDDPAFAPAAAGQGQGQSGAPQQPEAAQPANGAAPGGPGPRGVHGEPPGKQPHQLYLIAAGAQVDDEVGGPAEHAHRHPQHQHLGGPAAAEQGWAGGPTGSSGGPRQRSAPPQGGDGASRKRAASQLGGGDSGQRKRPANGAAAGQHETSAELQRLPTGMSAVRAYSAGVPASLARGSSALGGEAGPLARPMPGAPRSLQQRQQLLMNGGSVPGAPRQLAGAPRARTPAGATKPKPPPAAKAPSSGQRRASSGAAGGGSAASAHRFQYGDVVWAKIGVYPWWPAQLQRPTADEHFRPKHAASDMFCVFYGSNDYNWLPTTAYKPFTEAHPDYQKHASVKNKALQKAIDEAWVYGMQRERPDGPKYGSFAGGGGY